MTVRVGILGLGFMGKCHYDTYARVPGARVDAICDVDATKRSGDWSAIAGNIGGAGGRVDLSALRVHDRADRLLADPEIDVVDITLPTHLHADWAVKALEAGKDVICEKPMARTSAEARRMAKAAERTGRRLFVAHCIRYWPAYAKAREIVQAGRHGRVLSATFRRQSPTPLWSWRNWLQDPKKSGACALDLHIHDADFVLYCFGRPRAVTSHAAGFRKGRADHIVTAYDYGKDCLVTAEGAWEYAAGYPFAMTFSIAMERATLHFAADGGLHLYPVRGKPKTIKLKAGDGYEHELRDFIACIRKGRDSAVVSPASACESVALVEAELKSVRTGAPVRPKRR